MGEEGAREEEAPGFRLTQPLPKPKTFDGLSPKTFKTFVKQYEEWAFSMWGPNKNDRWISGLETLLEGQPLSILNSFLRQNKTYAEIKEELMETFRGESDPFEIKRLVALKELVKKPDEPWAVFITKLRSLLMELNPFATEDDLSARLKEHLMQKMDKGVMSLVTRLCHIKDDYSVKSIVEHLKSLDTIPSELYNAGSTEVMHLGLAPNNKDKDKEEKHCMYCGAQSHYMADCYKYEKTLNAITNLRLTESNLPRDRNTYDRRQEYSRGEERYQHDRQGTRGSSPYNRNYRGYSPYRNERYQGPQGRQDNDRNGGREYRGRSPYRNEWYQGSQGRQDNDRNGGREYRGRSPYSQNQGGREQYDRPAGRSNTYDAGTREGGRRYEWGRGGMRHQNWTGQQNTETLNY